MGAIKKLHIGFPGQSLNKYTKKLVDLGYKVCIVDQVRDADSDSEGECDELEAKISGTKKMNE